MKNMVNIILAVLTVLAVACSDDGGGSSGSNEAPEIYAFFPDIEVINTEGDEPDSTFLKVIAEDHDGTIESYVFTILTDESGGALSGEDSAAGKIYEAGAQPGYVSIKVTVIDDEGASEEEVIVLEVQSAAVSPANADLLNLQLSEGALVPAFDKNIKQYTVVLPLDTEEISVTPSSVSGFSTIIVNTSEVVSSGASSSAIAITEESYIIEIEVVSGDGLKSKVYTVTVDKIFDFFGCYYAYIDGTCARTAEEYKTFDPTILSGVYKIKPYLAEEPLNIYCDMETDGGGWMMVGFMGTDVQQSVIFGNYGTIVTDFSENTTNGLWSIDIHNNLLKGSEPLTEMAITLDNKYPTISMYEESDKVVYYKWVTYKISRYWSSETETGIYYVKLNAADEWDTETSWNSNPAVWYPDLNGQHLSFMHSGGPYSFYWGVGMGGNSTWNHYGYVWVR